MAFSNVTAKRPKGIINVLLVKGKNAYYKIPHSIRWIFWPFRFAYKFYNIFLLESWTLSGKEITSGQELLIMYAGHIEDKNYFASLVFGNSFQQKFMGRKWLWKVLKAVKNNEQNYSLSIIELPRKLLSLSKKMNSFYIPSWISGSFNISNNKYDIFKNRNTSLKSDISKIKRNRLDFEITHEQSQLRNFYFNMYEPYIKKIYGNKTVFFSSYDFVEREFKKRGVYKDLLLIKKDDDYIAGVLLYYKGKCGKLSVLGVKDGNMDYVKDGAIGAIYYFSTLYFEQKGFDRISLGGSRPFMKDGVLKYKKKWKPKIAHHTKTGFIIKMLSETNGCKGFFLNNPFVFEDASGVNGAVFVENNQELSQEYFENIYKNYYYNGMSKLTVYQFGKEKSNDACQIPSSLSEIITVQSI